MPPLVISTSAGSTARPWVSVTRRATACRARGSPSVGEYCNAVPAPSASTRGSSSCSSGAGNVSGAGNPPEKVMTSVDAASERIAVILSPARSDRRANNVGQFSSAGAPSGSVRDGRMGDLCEAIVRLERLRKCEV